VPFKGNRTGPIIASLELLRKSDPRRPHYLDPAGSCVLHLLRPLYTECRQARRADLYRRFAVQVSLESAYRQAELGNAPGRVAGLHEDPALGRRFLSREESES